jgi:hypothetical protein
VPFAKPAGPVSAALGLIRKGKVVRNVLVEQSSVSQLQGEARRRWFSSDYFDLISWQASDGAVIAFQLCYEKGEAERAVCWQSATGFSHHNVDEGEGPERRVKASPVFLPDGSFHSAAVIKRFQEESKSIDESVATFVLNSLARYGESKRK